MTDVEGLAVLVAAAAAGAFCLARRRGPGDGRAGRGARLVLWLAIASPLVFLLAAPEDRPRVLVQGRRGVFEALTLLAYAAAAAAAVGSLAGGPRRTWSAVLLVVVASVAALGVAVLRVR